VTLAYTSIAVAMEEGGTILSIVLNRPKGNVLTGDLLREVESALDAHRADRHLRLVTIRGAGGHFSFGASVEEHRRDAVADMLRTFHRVVRAVAAYPVPVAALVEGRCLGGAFELALCCHLVFAAEDARFACPEIKLGVIPPVFAVVGPRRLPGALAERLLLTGGELDATAAASAGFATPLAPNQDAHDALLAWYRTHLAPLSALALREATAAGRRASGLLDALEEPLASVERQYLDRVATSHDGNEGIEAFLARRTPRWEDA
jgi:cyclohexa-1,5-dienecarbonyl-CoA hydratase